MFKGPAWLQVSGWAHKLGAEPWLTSTAWAQARAWCSTLSFRNGVEAEETVENLIHDMRQPLAKSISNADGLITQLSGHNIDGRLSISLLHTGDDGTPER